VQREEFGNRAVTNRIAWIRANRFRFDGCRQRAIGLRHTVFSFQASARSFRDNSPDQWDDLVVNCGPTASFSTAIKKIFVAVGRSPVGGEIRIRIAVDPRAERISAFIESQPIKNRFQPIFSIFLIQIDIEVLFNPTALRGIAGYYRVAVPLRMGSEPSFELSPHHRTFPRQFKKM